MISIVIPVYNEEEVLSRNAEYFRKLADKAELIFIDGGSDDQTVRLALAFAEVVSSRKGRALQMNTGARLAHHDILLFLHADTRVDPEVLDRIENAVHRQNCAGGCLRQVIDHPGIIFRWIAWTGNLRAKFFKVFYGDQGIFVRRDVFERIGGFPNAALCEDVLLSRRLKSEGEVKFLSDPIYCSPRRWLSQGVFRTFVLNMRITAALLFAGNIDRMGKDYQDVR